MVAEHGSTDQVAFSTVKVDPEEQKIVAYHEMGHAIVARSMVSRSQ